MYLNRILFLFVIAISFPLSSLFGQCEQARFDFTGAQQTFTVPATVTELKITAVGAKGGDGSTDAGVFLIGGTGGLGSLVQSTITVTPNEQLFLYVGAIGGNGAIPISGVGGYNGGGDAGNADFRSGGGGGGTDIRQGGNTLADRILVAAGGGGGGTTNFGALAGGIGGDLIGGNGANGTTSMGGQGGTQISGGTGGTGDVSGTIGSLGQGGNGAVTGGAPSGAGGGGGYYGGGGGAADSGDSDGAAGGGGSSFTTGTNLLFVAGSTEGSGNGYVLIEYNCPAPAVVVAAPIPSMNQWGLFIFALLILNLGLIFIRSLSSIKRYH